MVKKIRQPGEDYQLFLDVIKGTKPLKRKNAKISKKQNNKQTKHILPISKKKQPEALIFESSESDDLLKLSSESTISYKRPDVSYKILRNLKKAKYNIDAVLDLHGLTIKSAEKELNHFLLDCIAQKFHVVLIIHGKGSNKEFPILKNKLNQWLRNLSLVLAFCTALTKHGGAGAIYVILNQTHEGK